MNKINNFISVVMSTYNNESTIEKSINSLLSQTYQNFEIVEEKKYGISPEDYDTMLKEQDNKCKICLVSFTTLKPQLIHVDHCHTTKQVRGLLCNLCNTGLGFFKDNTETLTNAIVYMEHTHTGIKDE